MDKDRVKGKLNDAAGRVKRQVGEWTDDSKLQAEGTSQQVKGKVQNAWGKTKDAVRNTTDDTRGTDTREEVDTEERREETHRKKDVA